MKIKNATHKIPVCEPALNGRELEYVIDAVKSTWISSSGRYIKAFEENFSSYIGLKHGITTTSGTTALHLALVAAGIKAGDEIILPDFTMIAPAYAVCYTGACPVFVDVDPETWTMDPAQISQKITPKTKAILPVHIYGHPAEMDPIRKIADEHKLILIEDAAEAHGAEYKNMKCGRLSDLAAFSFFSNKNITAGEGGMVVTNSDVLADRCRYYKNLCFPLNQPRSYVHGDIGFNYRMSNILAAIGVAQLEKIDEYVGARRRNAHAYNACLRDVAEIQLPVERAWAKNSYWMYGVLLTGRAKVTRDALMKGLLEDGIDTRPFFAPMHSQPSLKTYGADRTDHYAVSTLLSQNGFYLPSSSNLKPDQIHYITQCLKNRLSSI